MTQSKPRPGPWKLYAVTGKSGRNKLSLRAYAGRHICDISIYDDEDAANARLIAAAPELLDLARNIAGLDDGAFTRADLNYFRSLIREYRDEARAAIAKAEGGAS